MAHALGSRDNNDNWLLFDKLHAELFFPSRNYVRQTHSTAYCWAEVAGATFLIKFRDPKKAQLMWLSGRLTLLVAEVEGSNPAKHQGWSRH